MTITVSTMFIPVHDPDAALGFYRDALGLEVRNDVASGDFRWVTVGAAGQDVDIVLSQPHGGRSQAEGDALLSLVTQGSLQAAIFRSDDLDTTFEKVRASGAEVSRSRRRSPGAPATARSATRRATSCGSRRPDQRSRGLGAGLQLPEPRRERLVEECLEVGRVRLDVRRWSHREEPTERVPAGSLASRHGSNQSPSDARAGCVASRAPSLDPLMIRRRRTWSSGCRTHPSSRLAADR